MPPELESNAVKTCSLLPPTEGLNADPLLYGVAAGVAQLFPLPDNIDLTRVPCPGRAVVDPSEIEGVDRSAEHER